MHDVAAETNIFPLQFSSKTLGSSLS